MIKIENIDVWGFEHAVRGCRNPMNSWAKSDSGYWKDGEDDYVFVVGKNDLDLMQRLYKAGTEHRKYLRQIFVSMDITAPLYWISELDTYKVGTVRNSCSFMHKGVSKPFEITDFSIHDDRVYEVLSPFKKKEYVLKYLYETDEYKIFTGENGREYKVYKNGRVVACSFEYIDTMGRHRTLSERECKPTITNSGYFELNIGGRSGQKWMLHRLVASTWLENADECDTVNHIDGDKGNNSVENLEWCSLSENIKKGFEDGLYENGKSLHTKYLKWKNTLSLTSPTQRLAMRKDREAHGYTCKQISEKYGISIKQANNIISNKKAEDDELFALCYVWENTIDSLNKLRDEYLETKDNAVFQMIRCLLPSGYNLRFTYTMNYENVMSIINQREGHKLDEWREMVETLRTLPYVKEIRGEE